MTLNKATVWLKFASWVLIGFGILGAISAHPNLNFLSRPLAQMILWPSNEPNSILGPETRVTWAILGGITTGWGVMNLLLTTRLFHREPEALRSIMLMGIWAWFITDGTGSALSGSAFNAVLNLGFLILFLIPLWRPIKLENSAEVPIAT